MQNPNVIKAQIGVLEAFLADHGIMAKEPTFVNLLARMETASKAALAAETSNWTAAGGPMSDAQYVARRGVCCPSCGSTEDTSGSQLTVDNGTASQPMVCGACDAEWADMYTLTGYSDLEGGVNLETIQAVVDDVKQALFVNKFATEGEARTAIDAACDSLGEQLSDAEMKIAVERLTS